MAITRFGHLDDFTQKNNNVGIGTSTPQDKMEVIGGTRSTDLRVAGIATLTSAGGFIEKHIEYVEDQIIIDAGDSGTLSGEIVVGSGQTMVVGAAATTSQGTVEALKVYDMFQPPSGRTNQRPPAKTGAIFYNFDFKTIEFFDGDSWKQVDNTTRRGRAVFGGGRGPADLKDIEFINIASLGNSLSFGELITATSRGTAVSSEIRGVFAGGGFPTENNVMEYITIASGGNAIDFGDMIGEDSGADRATPAGASSSTRGVFAGGGSYPSSQSNIIDYIQIATIGNALDFGDLTVERAGANVATNGKKMLIGSGGSGGGKSIDQIIIQSKGNATDFGGSTTYERFQGAHCSNSVRGIWAGGQMHNPYHLTSSIELITIESGGNAIDFGGTLFEGLREPTGACNQTRGVFAGGINPSGVNTIQFVTIASTGNASDFGDISEPKRFSGGLSDSHGGLGGF